MTIEMVVILVFVYINPSTPAIPKFLDCPSVEPMNICFGMIVEVTGSLC